MQRIHPAASRVKLLASATPSSFVAFDLLGLGDDDLRGEPFGSRRSALERALGDAEPPVYVTPTTPDPAVARDWFDRFEGAGLDGVVAKPVELTYREGERVMLKVKHERTADCVVGGFRWHKDGGGVGSLLLGLYDEQGALHHVGVASGFAVALRRSLVDDLAPYRLENLEGHPWNAMTAGTGSTRRPGGLSRWNAGKDISWQAVAPELVCEVGYDHLQGDRFRHAGVSQPQDFLSAATRSAKFASRRYRHMSANPGPGPRQRSSSTSLSSVVSIRRVPRTLNSIADSRSVASRAASFGALRTTRVTPASQSATSSGMASMWP